MRSQLRSKRMPSGSRLKGYRKKRAYELGRLPTFTKVGEKSVREDRVRGANVKRRLLHADTANVLDKKSKKHIKAKIKTIVESPANRNFIRRNIITKSTVIETEAGKAVVTSRPGQKGIVDAVLV